MQNKNKNQKKIIQKVEEDYSNDEVADDQDYNSEQQDQAEEEDDQIQGDDNDQQEEEEDEAEADQQSEGVEEEIDNQGENKDNNQKNGYIIDDFVVNDDEISEDEDERRDKKRKLKRKKKEQEIEPDEDDLELVAENIRIGEFGQKRRLKRNQDRVEYEDQIDIGQSNQREDRYQRDRMKKDIEQNEYEGYDEQEERLEPERYKRVKRDNLVDGSGQDLVQSVFFKDRQYDEEGNELNEQEEDLDEDIGAINKKKYFPLNFNPVELEERFATEFDKEIRLADIPERLQIRFKKRPIMTDKELIDETRWIYDQLNKKNRDIQKYPSDVIQKKINRAIELIRKNYYEVMYLYFYKKPQFLPEIQLNELWEIYELDAEWADFYQLKEQVQKQFALLEGNFMRIDEQLKEFLKSNNDKYKLQYLHEYATYHLAKYKAEEDTSLSSNKFKKPIKRVFAREAIEYKLDEFAIKAGLSADEFAFNILQGTKFIPKNPILSPEKTADEYIQINQPLVYDPLTTLTSLCKYMAQEIYYQPLIRAWAVKQYYSKVTISTEPTLKGKKEYDVNNYNYCVKRIQKRPQDKFNDHLWLLMLKNEKEGLIRIKFQLPWDEDLSNAKKDFLDMKDDLYKQLLNLYISPLEKAQDDDQKEIIKQWNILRGEVLRLYLSKNLYPALELQLRQDLLERSEKFIIRECGKKLRELLMSSPWCSNESNKESPRVFGAVYDNVKQKLAIVAVNSNGQLVDYLILNHFGLPFTQNSTDPNIKSHYDKEYLELTEFMKQHQPHLITVSTNCLEARRIKQKLTEFNSEFNKDNPNIKQRAHISYSDYLVPQLFSKTQKAQQEFQHYPELIAEATSLCRLRQNPLAEILNLWSDNNDQNALFYIPFHHLQNMVKPNKLKQEYERVIVEVINQVGVDVNKLIENKHLQAQLQFISGLGPRKASYIIESLKSRKRPFIKIRIELWTNKLLAKTVYANCIGFLKVQLPEITLDSYDNEEYELDILDTTRIHPENYVLAKKIARDALDDEEYKVDDTYKNHCVTQIIRQPQKLDDLDLEDYADRLEKLKHMPNMLKQLQFIQQELTCPFKDPRQYNKELDNEKLFYKLCKENPLFFGKYSLVNCVITKVGESFINVKIQDNDLTGFIKADDINYNKQNDEGLGLRKFFSEGDVLKARIIDINFEESNFKIKLSQKMVQMTPDRIWPDQFRDLNRYFKVIPDEDYPVLQDFQPKQLRYIPRKINHPKFKNISMAACIEFLQDKQVGDYLIRPSSKSSDYLNLSWKFQEKIIVHLQIREENKLPNALIGSKLYIGQESFDSLDEIIDKYIISCNSIMKQVVTHKKFIKGEQDLVEELLSQEKENDPKSIPYLFGCFETSPQYIVLLYIPKQMDILKEYIKVKPMGLMFHGLCFPSLNMLVSWFKEHFKTAEYQRYIKKVAPPILESKQTIEQQQNIQNQNNRINVKQEKFVKQEKGIGVKQEMFGSKQENRYQQKQCSTCLQYGHSANQCTGQFKQQDNQFNNDRQSNNRQNRSRSRSHSKEVNRKDGDRSRGFNNDRRGGFRNDRGGGQRRDNDRQDGNNFSNDRGGGDNRGRGRGGFRGRGRGGFNNNRNNSNNNNNSSEGFGFGGSNDWSTTTVSQQQPQQTNDGW